MEFSIEYYPLKFIKPVGTSRGVMHIKNSWFLALSHDGASGLGEISIIEGLSKEWTSKNEFEKVILRTVEALNKFVLNNGNIPKWNELGHLFPEITNYPSILFGLEVALLDLENGGRSVLFNNSFSMGKRKIPINGLIWMGNEHEMLSQIEEKLDSGFTTIKMKIGAIDFEKEYALLKSIRSRYTSSEITLRVDANGAFNAANVYSKLKRLADLEIHSIEQPVAAGQQELMSELCAAKLIPIALDEELIGIHAPDKKIELLNQIHPPFIILKPSLHGGISGIKEWINLAEERDIQWWVTSALESNVGLNAICQFVAEYENLLPQGLGTGSLYENNVPSALNVRDGHIFISSTIQHS